MSIFHRQDKWDTDNFNDNFNEVYSTYKEVITPDFYEIQRQIQAAHLASKKAQLAAMRQAQQEAHDKAVAESVDAYIPADVFKPFTKKILNKMSEDDCRAMLQAVFDAISKEDSTIKLSPSVETAIIAIMVDKAS